MTVKKKTQERILSMMGKVDVDPDYTYKAGLQRHGEEPHPAVEKHKPKQKENFVDFMRKSPLYGVDIDLEREQTPTDVVHTAGGSGHGKCLLKEKTYKFLAIAQDFDSRTTTPAQTSLMMRIKAMRSDSAEKIARQRLEKMERRTGWKWILIKEPPKYSTTF
ncbi:MAG: hypothetical protein ACLP29_08835 [Dissulfurispiraceae bacterium]